MESTNRTSVFGFILILLSMLLACDGPEDIPPNTIDQDPEYYFVGTLGGEQIQFEAGKDNIKHDTYHTTDIYGTVVYGSRFAEDSCHGGCRELLFEITDIHIGTQDEAGQLEGISPGVYPLLQPQDTQEFLLTARVNGEVNASNDHVWTVNAGTPLFADSLAWHALPGEPILLCFESSSFLGCSYQQCIEAVISNHPPCYTRIQVETSPDGLLIEAIPHGVPPYQFAWSNGSTESAIEVSTEPLSTLEYNLTVTDHAGTVNTIVHTFQIAEGTYNDCIIDFDLDIQEIPGTAYSQFASIAIVYRDSTGEEYRSDYVAQTDNEVFEILSVTEIDDVPGGKTGIQLMANVNCELFTSNGHSLHLSSDQAVMAFSRIP